MNPKIILASTSPRRRELLAGLGLVFTALDPDIEERPLPGELPRAYVARNAQLKAEAAVGRPEVPNGQQLAIIAADTIVVLGATILEKPRDPAHACVMLASLAGRSHTVLTGVHVLCGVTGSLTAHSEVVATDVTMKALTAAEISAYVATGEPLDKAGSYAAQGQGGYMVSRVHGSYTNVVGLPLTELVAILTSHCGVALFQNFSRSPA